MNKKILSVFFGVLVVAILALPMSAVSAKNYDPDSYWNILCT